MRRFGTTLLTLLSLSILPALTASAVTIVAPSGYDTVEGNDASSFPFNNFEGRYQQAYGADQFDSGLLQISEIAFRTDAEFGELWSSNLTFTINLSTSVNPVGSLSTTFADNIGGDAATVYSAASAIFGGNSAGAPGPNAFDLILTLDTPFLYDPSNGDLLMEVLMETNTVFVPLNGFTYLDAVESTTGQFDIGIQRVWNSGGDTATLTGLTDLEGFGLVTRFDYEVVPEPSTGLLLMCGLIGLAARRHA